MPKESKSKKPKSWVDVFVFWLAMPDWRAAAADRQAGLPVAWYISHRLPGKNPLVHQPADFVAHVPVLFVSYG